MVISSQSHLRGEVRGRMWGWRGSCGYPQSIIERFIHLGVMICHDGGDHFHDIFTSQITIHISNLNALLIFQMCTV